MKKKKKKLLLIGGIIVLLIIAGAGLLFAFNSSAPPQKPSDLAPGEQKVKMLKPEDIGLTLTPRNDKKAVNMRITKLSGIKSIEYEISYDADVVDTESGQKNTTPRGVVGSPIEIKDSDTEIRREIELGTCSRNICKYDKVVSDVKFVIKVTYKNGDVGSVEQKIAL